MTVGMGGATAGQLLHGSPHLAGAVDGLQDTGISNGLVDLLAQVDVKATVAKALDLDPPQAAR